MPEILSIGADNTVATGEIRAVILGADFGLEPGEVVVSPSDNISAAGVVLTADFVLWEDDRIEINVPQNVPLGATYWFVRDANGFANAGGFPVTVTAAAEPEHIRFLTETLGPNLKILPFNRWADTSLGSIYSSGAQSGYAASETQVQQRSRRWRSTDLIYPVWLKRDLGTSYRIGAIAIVAHNLTRAGTVRVMISDNVDMSSPFYDSGDVDAWENLWPEGKEPDYTGSGLVSEWASSAGLPTAVAIAELPEPTSCLFFVEVSGRYIEIHFSDSANPDSYIEVAYVYAGIVITADINYSRLQVTQVDSARIAESGAGQEWTQSVYKKTEIDAELELQPESKALGFWMFAFSHLGISKEFVVVLRDQKASWRFWLVLYARFRRVPRMTGTHFERYSFSLEIEELVG